jgi:hypothetical protein
MTTTLFDQPEAAVPENTALAERPLTDPTPMVLLQQAIESGLNPDHLEKLMALQERWEKNQAEKAFAVAMAACQAEMPTVATDAVNTETKSRFARFETIQEVAKPIYNKHGFSLSFGDGEQSPFEGFKRIVCDCTHSAGKTRRYHIDLPIDGIGPKGNPIGGMNRVQGCVSTNSYGERVLTCNIFNITIAGKDRDGRDTQKITEEQVAIICEWIEQIEIKPDPILKWMDIEKFNDLPMSKYSTVINELKRKAREKGIKL